MRHTFLLCGLLSLANLAFADHHQLAIDARQPIVELDVTSVTLGDDTSVINAESKMGVYGRVYLSFVLSSNATGNGGTYTFQGRGYVDDETMFSGSGVGVWHRKGPTLVMHQLVNISDGTVNFDRIVMNPLERTGTLAAYALK